MILKFNKNVQTRNSLNKHLIILMIINKKSGNLLLIFKKRNIEKRN